MTAELEEVEEPAEPAIAQDGGLTGTVWAWNSFTNPVEQFTVEQPASYTLTFREDGTVDIKADCNNAIGSFSADDSSLEIEIGPMTMAACPPGSRSDDFVQYLGFAAIYFFEEDDLFIDLFADGGTMQFRAQGRARAVEFAPEANPIFATLVLGGGETLWLDPSMVSIRSGAITGPGVDASTLGESCAGTIPSHPDVVFNWQEHEGLGTLNIFTLSLGDLTLVLVTPSGEVLCNVW